jgi:hypothetical protein
MSQGNASACIGLANTSKIPAVGLYVQASTPPPGPEAESSYVGVNGTGYWGYNPVQETDFSAAGGFTVPGNSGAATGKVARLVTCTAPLTVSADQTCAVSAAGVATAGAAQAYKTYNPVGMIIPTGSFFWVFLV